jgi:hypothetical protein
MAGSVATYSCRKSDERRDDLWTSMRCHHSMSMSTPRTLEMYERRMKLHLGKRNGRSIQGSGCTALAPLRTQSSFSTPLDLCWITMAASRIIDQASWSNSGNHALGSLPLKPVTRNTRDVIWKNPAKYFKDFLLSSTESTRMVSSIPESTFCFSVSHDRIERSRAALRSCLTRKRKKEQRNKISRRDPII